MDRLSLAAAAGFEAARRLSAPLAEARSHRLHGHGFQASLRCAGSAPLGDIAGGEVDALEAALHSALAPLDYRLLNDVIAEPSDENLAFWLSHQLAALAPRRVGVGSTPRAGALWRADRPALLWRRFPFEAAHRLPRVAPGHKCGRMHGHGFVVEIRARSDGGDAAAVGTRVAAQWAPLQARLHHACLNDIEGLENPTSERLAGWIWEHLRGPLPMLERVSVHETQDCGAHFDGSRYLIWKDFSLDSAIRLAHAPAGDARARVHGHSYLLRLRMAGAIDEVLGWTIDFGDVKDRFHPVFARLDHHPLHEIADLAQGGCAAIARWIGEEALRVLPQIDRLELHQTPGCGVLWQVD
jgi:6-pyruvoyltetrahydropterin/6-carboxytetrahydropterin synthase